MKKPESCSRGLRPRPGLAEAGYSLLACAFFAGLVMGAEEAATDVQRVSAELDRAEKKAAYGDWLYTEGVLAKSEAEQRTLLVVKLKSELAEARLRVAKQEAQAEQKRFENHEGSKDANDKAQGALAAAAASAEAAARDWKRAQLDAALLNLKRQQRLYEQGITPRSDLRRAEEAVAALKAN